MRLFNSSLPNIGTNNEPIKKMFVFRGQSNQNTRWNFADIPVYLQSEIPNSFYWYGGKWEPVAASMPTNSGAGDFCNMINFAYLMNQAYPNEVFYYDFWCVGGTDIDYWSSPSGDGWSGGLNNYNGIAASNRTIKIESFFWLQGETDAITTIAANAYGGKEVQLVSDMRANYQDSKWITAQITSFTGGGLPYTAIVRQAKTDNFANNIYEGLVETDDLVLNPDGQHFTLESQITIGQRYFDTYQSLI
jgi:hypothetical protein